jgi:hypothetical protein
MALPAAVETCFNVVFYMEGAWERLDGVTCLGLAYHVRRTGSNPIEAKVHLSDDEGKPLGMGNFFTTRSKLSLAWIMEMGPESPTPLTIVVYTGEDPAPFAVPASELIKTFGGRLVGTLTTDARVDACADAAWSMLN